MENTVVDEKYDNLKIFLAKAIERKEAKHLIKAGEMASMFGYIDILQELYDQNLLIVTQTMYSNACVKGHDDVFKFLYKHADETKTHPLYVAAYYQNEAMVDYLLADGPGYYVLCDGLIGAAAGGNIKIVKKLVFAGADVNHHDGECLKVGHEDQREKVLEFLEAVFAIKNAHEKVTSFSQEEIREIRQLQGRNIFERKIGVTEQYTSDEIDIPAVVFMLQVVDEKDVLKRIAAAVQDMNDEILPHTSYADLFKILGIHDAVLEIRDRLDSEKRMDGIRKGFGVRPPLRRRPTSA